ncbi:BQ5605_C019g08837 [Microbotryum silenes-dioicae]|uniref:BQ5605_C019g08837 protein n=1 Tax=Microbotryum silenes-dioicae TaxID=796604 RepID=A0A2X0LVT3_9BASI|nr:BQ5605_C019g08837 [Microbotryum silenes-dioicae]
MGLTPPVRNCIKGKQMKHPKLQHTNNARLKANAECPTKEPSQIYRGVSAFAIWAITIWSLEEVAAGRRRFEELKRGGGTTIVPR